MDEAEWLGCSDPEKMLKYLRGNESERKLRLFAVACCQMLLRKVRLHPWYSHGIVVAELFADGKATEEELELVHHYPPSEWCLQNAPRFDPEEVAAAGQSHRVTKLAINACWNAMEVEAGFVIADCASTNAAWAATQPGPVMPDDNGISAGRLAAEMAVQADILRDIIGNPFRPAALDRSWRTPTTLAIAQTAYEYRILPASHLEPEKLAVLADALEDAGCTDADILSHLRGPGPHVRGCWVVDLLLGKS
jgi:hypothetical protein